MLVQCMNQDGAPRAVDVEKESRTYGWVFSLHLNGQWVTLRKATEEELTRAERQVMFLSMLPERVEPVQASHTKEPWIAEGHCVFFSANAGGFSLSDCPDSHGNARRIAACVNACAELPQDALDGGWTALGMSRHARNVEKQRDELLAALTELLHRAENFHACNVNFSDFEVAKVAMDAARAAIAKVHP